MTEQERMEYYRGIFERIYYKNDLTRDLNNNTLYKDFTTNGYWRAYMLQMGLKEEINDEF